jgi:hypothetical protein
MSLGMNSVGLNQPYSKQIAMRANSEQTVQAQEQVQTQPEYTLTDVFKYEHKKNGLVERAYNGVKNLTGLGTGSKKVKAVIAKAEKGEISEEEAQKTIDKYRKSQANSAQAFGDVLSIGSSGMTFFALRNYLKKLEIFKDLCIDVMSSINTYVISWTLEYDAYDIAFLENINSVLNQIDYCNSVSILANNIEYNKDEAQKLEQYLNENYKDILKLTFKTSLFTDTKSSPSSHYFKVEWNKIEGE